MKIKKMKNYIIFVKEHLNMNKYIIIIYYIL